MQLFKSKKTVLITGASSGIGADIARSLAKNYNLILCGRNQERLERIGKETKAKKLYNFDINQPFEISEKIDILINNAGISTWVSIIDMDQKQFDDTINTNLRAAFKMVKATLPNMIDKKFGRIINIGSNVTGQGVEGMCHYTASKSGLVGFTRSIAIDLAKYNITCNVVSPGFIKTPIHNVEFTDDLENGIVQNMRIPIKRLGHGSDVAKIVKFLISDEAEYITGQNIHVNGGLFMN